MARKRGQAKSDADVGDYRHGEARRKNNSPAGIAPTYEVRERQLTPYTYDPHLDPQLQKVSLLKTTRALKAQIDPEAFAQMRGTVSFPFKPGEHQRIAVKVIDFRGNEVVRVVPLEPPKLHGGRK